MTNDELRALAKALEHMDLAPCKEAAAYLRACADAEPVGYVTANGLRSLRQDDATVLLYAHDYLIRPDHVALYTHPAPAAQQAEPKREPRPCTCHPDDNPPVPCAQKYVLSECRPEPTEAQIDYRALYHDLLFAVGNKHAGETRHETALRYIREAERSDGAALAARDDPT